jgi:hypothetical protein
VIGFTSSIWPDVTDSVSSLTTSGLFPSITDGLGSLTRSGLYPTITDALGSLTTGGLFPSISDSLSDLSTGGLFPSITDSLGELSMSGLYPTIKDTLSSLTTRGLFPDITNSLGSLTTSEFYPTISDTLSDLTTSFWPSFPMLSEEVSWPAIPQGFVDFAADIAQAMEDAKKAAQNVGGVVEEAARGTGDIFSNIGEILDPNQKLGPNDGESGPFGFASGGIVTGPTSAVIGEAGDDEAVIPLNSRGARFMQQAVSSDSDSPRRTQRSDRGIERIERVMRDLASSIDDQEIQVTLQVDGEVLAETVEKKKSDRLSRTI